MLPEGTAAAKFNTTHGPDLAPVNGTLYFHDDHALWVRIERGAPEMFPTVYTLWNNPGLLPVVLTHQAVMERLVGGADLMVPGLVGPPFPAGAVAGALVGIADVERPTVPVAVGVCEMDVAKLDKAIGGKGRAVRLLHWVGDEIYKHGGGGDIPAELESSIAEITAAVAKLDVAPVEEEEKASSSGEEDVRAHPGALLKHLAARMGRSYGVRLA